MMNYFYSASTNSFYPAAMKADYERAGSWPVDATEVDDDIYIEFTDIPPDGMERVAGKSGYPVWSEIPPPTSDELMIQAENQRELLKNEANEYIGSRQWPGKAALGRLKGDELNQYNLWLDYLDALEVTDISTAPDIEWPVKPE